ncbi:MAG: nucleotidyltransferase domain-containing protein, partial [Gammaproteobacteria bacterium]|nr:nucleotidyltransferase domain-containing protein [Gammaproteobacteria bacterium]
MILHGRLRAAAKRLLVALGSRAWFRPVGMALVNRLTRHSFDLLLATPGVQDVYVRGSYARGNFVPLSSDVDLALVLTDAGGRSLETVSAVHRSMRKVRRRNPSIRDWWHHMILASELPVVRSFSDLYGSHEWRDRQGSANAPSSDWIDERLRRAAAWSQLCLWSGSAFHAFLYPDDRVHSFEAGVKKSGRFARLMGVSASSPLPANRGARLVAVYRMIEKGAERMLDGGVPTDSATPAIIETCRARFVLLEDGLDDNELIERFDDPALRAAARAPVTYVLPAAAIAV